MYEASLAKNGYEHSSKSSADMRGIEYQIFARVTQQLASDNKHAHDYHPKLTQALHNNLRLWTILAVDVANDNNELPAKLRSSIFYLAEFTRQHTTKVHAGEADTKILVDINTMVMRGLRNTPMQESTG
ncbi:MAG: flagellar biosynthesis regulator FlaF [Marinicaulis sp.]|nr:flagellar biosynthesis regulator FlaF [Marinicaulis sp.]